MVETTSILLVDDDPLHLQLYRMIIETAGFKGLPVLVSYSGMDFPNGETVHAALVDYRLGPHLTAPDAVRQVRERYPSIPIFILSDVYDAPSDTAPFVDGFVRKGNPEKLLSTLREAFKKSAQIKSAT